MTNDPYAGAPDHIRTAAQRNLRAVDRMYDKFNTVAASMPTPIVRPIASPLPATSAIPPVAPPATMTLGSNIDTSIGAPLPSLPTVNATSRLNAPAVAPASAAVPTTPNAYVTHPDAYGQTASPKRGAVPAVNLDAVDWKNTNFTPRPETKKYQEQFGWGG